MHYSSVVLRRGGPGVSRRSKMGPRGKAALIEHLGALSFPADGKISSLLKSVVTLELPPLN